MAARGGDAGGQTHSVKEGKALNPPWGGWGGIRMEQVPGFAVSKEALTREQISITTALALPARGRYLYRRI